MKLKSGYVRNGLGVVKVSLLRYELRSADSDGRCDMAGMPVLTFRDWATACRAVDEIACPKPPKETDDEYAARIASVRAAMTKPSKSESLPPVRAMRDQGYPF